MQHHVAGRAFEQFGPGSGCSGDTCRREGGDAHPSLALWVYVIPRSFVLPRPSLPLCYTELCLRGLFPPCLHFLPIAVGNSPDI